MKTILERLREQEAIIISGIGNATAALDTIEKKHLYEAVHCRNYHEYYLKNEKRLGLSRLYQKDLHWRRNLKMVELTGMKFRNAKASIAAAAHAKKIDDPAKRKEYLKRLAKAAEGNEISEKHVKVFTSSVAAEYDIAGVGDEYGTPDWIFKPLDNIFHFDVDAASTDKNRKVKRHWTEKDDGLAQDWTKVKTVWVNPPFSNMAAWATKAYESALEGANVVMFAMNTTEVNWFQRYAPYVDLVFIRDRVQFEDAGESNRFGSMLLFWHLENWHLRDGEDHEDWQERLRMFCWKLGVFIPAVNPLYQIAWDARYGEYPDRTEDEFTSRLGW